MDLMSYGLMMLWNALHKFLTTCSIYQKCIKNIYLLTGIREEDSSSSYHFLIIAHKLSETIIKASSNGSLKEAKIRRNYDILIRLFIFMKQFFIYCWDKCV